MRNNKVSEGLISVRKKIAIVLSAYFPGIFLFLLFNVVKKLGKYEIVAAGNTVKIIDEKKVVTIKNGRNIIHDLRQLTAYFDLVHDISSDTDYSKPGLHYVPYLHKDFFISEIPDHPFIFEGYIEKYKPKDGDIVFDCGASCGLMTYQFSKLVGDNGKVISFEPSDNMYNDLVRNIEYHKLKNVIPVKKALWHNDGKVKFINSGVSSAIVSCIDTLPKAIRPSQKECEVETLSIGTAIETFGVPNLIKMDIEGAEQSVIGESKDTLSEYAINFAIASHHLIDGKQTRDLITKYFDEIGYHTETGFEIHSTTWAWKS